MKQDFLGKVVFITGASSGIGEALARLFAQRGAQVAIAARRGERLRELAHEMGLTGGIVLPVICDVTDERSVRGAIEKTRIQFGKIDIVIANAGFNLRGKFESLRARSNLRHGETSCD